MTEFEIAQIAMELFKLHVKADDNETTLFSYEWCVDQVKKAHGVGEKCEVKYIVEKGTDFEKALQKARKVGYEEEFNKGYSKGYKQGLEDGGSSAVTVRVQDHPYYKKGFEDGQKIVP